MGLVLSKAFFDVRTELYSLLLFRLLTPTDDRCSFKSSSWIASVVSIMPSASPFVKKDKRRNTRGRSLRLWRTIGSDGEESAEEKAESDESVYVTPDEMVYPNRTNGQMK